ncbi:hypothetical protein, partial [Enterococcus faecalis]|uniref:hypothetical protein n=1 Tax=Enterococcus faecalis TaxID=1351 RepID=UPI0039850E7F
AALLCAAMALGAPATAQSARPAEGPPPRRDAANPANPFSAPQLEPVRIYGEQVGERVYHREDIAATPSSNRDLSTLVSSHPAVRTNPGAASSQDRG